MRILSESLSTQEAQKLVLLSQKLPPAKPMGNALDATLSAIEHLGYIQIDTISVVQRAHHHTLWNRNPRYENFHLDHMVANKQVFEYWSHAAAYLPMCDYRFSLYRKQAILDGKENHWYKRDNMVMKSVLKRIADEGPLMAKDFDSKGKKIGEWRTKPTKQALENLYMQGDLMISSRHNFHKVYDLAERVIPTSVDTTLPSQDEYIRFLISRYLQSNGLGQASEMAYLLKNTKPLVVSTLKDMLSNNEVLQIEVGENSYYALPNALKLLNKPLSRNKLKILSPFDNLLIQRKRMKALFNFDYLIECYVPEAKRQYGYFSSPILWDGKLVARIDCKAERKASLLHIKHLALEPGLTKTDAFSVALSKEIKAFMNFNDCKQVKLHRTTPTSFKPVLESAFSTFN